MQFNEEGRERVVSYQSRQMKSAERNYPVHHKELLAMRYALIKFRVYLLGELTFAVYVDHASLRTAMKSPSLQDPDDAAQRGVSLASWTDRTLVSPGAASAVPTPANYAPK
ncbi:hypothetical protein PC121_g3729 [Phytophthora cactorum]|nr:hypothetical protein PC121_g3729 [Phytophthora cactorum]